MVEKKESRNIGINIKPPTERCTDNNCPYHGTLPIRGQILIGTVVSTKMDDTISVKREYMRYIKKYERYEKRTSTYHAHLPPCITVNEGEQVRIAEC